MTDTRTALVVGGGIAGPVAAMALQAAGIEATVVESYPDPGHGAAGTPESDTAGAPGHGSAGTPGRGAARTPGRGAAGTPGHGSGGTPGLGAGGTPGLGAGGTPETRIGGGMSIAPNGMNALAVLGLDDVVRAVGRPMRSMVLSSGTGKRLAELAPPAELGPLTYVWRDDVYRVLRDAALDRGIRIEHGRRLTGLTDDGGSVSAVFSTGTSMKADILVGADGIRSTVRRLIDDAAPTPAYAGLVSFGASVRGAGVPPTGDRMHMVFGKHAFLGYQVFDDGEAVWFVNLPHASPMSVAEVRAVDPSDWLRSLRTALQDDRSPGTALLARTTPDDLIVVGPVESMGTVPTWHKGRVVLVGDSVHAPSSSSGQGASLAIESAVQLGRCLRDLPHEQAFAAYERLRRPRVERIIANAARTNSDKTAGPVGRVIRDLVLPVAMKLMKPEKMAWQFDYRIDWDTPVTV